MRTWWAWSAPTAGDSTPPARPGALCRPARPHNVAMRCRVRVAGQSVHVTSAHTSKAWRAPLSVACCANQAMTLQQCDEHVSVAILCSGREPMATLDSQRIDALVQKQGGREVVLERQRACQPGSSCVRTPRATDTTTSRRPLHRASGTWASWTPWYVPWPCPGKCNRAHVHSMCALQAWISLCTYPFIHNLANRGFSDFNGKFRAPAHVQHARVLNTVTAAGLSETPKVCPAIFSVCAGTSNSLEACIACGMHTDREEMGMSSLCRIQEPGKTRKGSEGPRIFWTRALKNSIQDIYPL